MTLFALQEIAHEAAHSTFETGVEAMVTSIVLWLKLGLEVVSVLLVSVGAVVALYFLGRAFLSPGRRSYQQTRLVLSRFLTLALEFQLAADIVATAVAPSWDQLGKLGAIAAVRTFLNYFLGREMKEEEEAEEIVSRRSEGTT